MSTTACSEKDALGQELRDIGLEQNQLDPNIFSGDELVILMCEQESIGRRHGASAGMSLY